MYTFGSKMCWGWISNASNELDFPCILFIYHISLLICSFHSHLETPYCIYILWLYQIFFLLWMFLCCIPSYSVVLLVALMWNVCAEPIECCVYIKATLFLTIPNVCRVFNPRAPHTNTHTEQCTITLSPQQTRLQIKVSCGDEATLLEWPSFNGSLPCA